jgi:Tol biopolymer transport system component
MLLARRARATTATVLALVCALGIVFAQSAAAAWPGGNGKIVFVKFNFASFSAQIYSMDSQGKAQTNLSAAGGGTSPIDIQPSVSPDGKRIAFVRGTFLDPMTITAQLWTMNIDGSHQTSISNNAPLASESGPTWTEDGSKILFVRAPSGSFPGGGGSIWIRRADGTGTPRQLTPGSSDANPAMSPDGDLIAFSRPVGGPRHLFVMKADGNGAASDLGPGAKPDWSPDSRRLVYGQAGPGPITVVRVSNPSDKQVLAGPGNEAPAWSPDGTQIVYMNCTSGPACQIAVMTATGQNKHDITSDRVMSNQKPNWQAITTADNHQGGDGGG